MNEHDPRAKHPGRTNDDPYCINCDCPSAFSCRRFSSEPWQGETGTIYINPKPTLLGGWLCGDFQPEDWNPLYKAEDDPRLLRVLAKGMPAMPETGTGSAAKQGQPGPKGSPND